MSTLFETPLLPQLIRSPKFNCSGGIVYEGAVDQDCQNDTSIQINNFLLAD